MTSFRPSWRYLKALVLSVLVLFFLFARRANNAAESKVGLSIKTLQKQRVLVVFMAIGTNKDRAAIVKRNMESMPSETASFAFSCIIFDYAPFKERQPWTDGVQKCSIVRAFGWNCHQFIRSLAPLLVKQFSYLFLVLEDVELRVFDFDRFFQYQQFFALNLASPSLAPGTAHWPLTHQVNHSDSRVVGRLVSHMEFFAFSFDVAAWSCFWDLIDFESGVACYVDQWIPKYCAQRVPGYRAGVFDIFLAAHRQKEVGRSHKMSPEQLSRSIDRQRERWRDERGIHLNAVSEVPQNVLGLLRI